MAVDIATVRLAGRWWRQLPAGLDPVRRPDPPRDARWQRGEVVDAVYLADSPETAWAEWYRWLAESGLPPRAGLPRDLWRVEVELDGVADLRSAGALAAIDLGAPRAARREYRPSREWVSASIARAGRRWSRRARRAQTGVVLCVFWPAPEDALVDHRSHERVTEAPEVPRGLRT